MSGEASDMDAGREQSSNYLLLESERSSWSTKRNGFEHAPEADGIATPLLSPAPLSGELIDCWTRTRLEE